MPTQAHESQRVMSTQEAPYHYVGSGLSNVYLVGVEYERSGDAQQSAEILHLDSLLQAIADTVVSKKSALTGEEMRFLRKRLRIAAKDFATLVGVTPEQYSRIERGESPRTQYDLLIRFVYAGRRKLTQVSEHLTEPTWRAAFDSREKIFAHKNEQGAWQVTLAA